MADPIRPPASPPDSPRRSIFHELPMRVFLRNKQTRLYRADLDEWVVGNQHAVDFISVPWATTFALDQGLAGVEIILKWDSLPDEVILPVLPAYRDFQSPDSVAAYRLSPVYS